MKVQTSIDILQDGINRTKDIVLQMHTSTYNQLRPKFIQYFSELVPGRNADMKLLNESDIREGFEFVLFAENENTRVGTTGNVENDIRSYRSVIELSGGQKSMLGLSFVFACALHKQTPLYLFDEIDAALDETNQQAVARIVAAIFKKSQVLCVSHHVDFQVQAMRSISVLMKNGETIITE